MAEITINNTKEKIIKRFEQIQIKRSNSIKTSIDFTYKTLNNKFLCLAYKASIFEIYNRIIDCEKSIRVIDALANLAEYYYKEAGEEDNENAKEDKNTENEEIHSTEEISYKEETLSFSTNFSMSNGFSEIIFLFDSHMIKFCKSNYSIVMRTEDVAYVSFMNKKFHDKILYVKEDTAFRFVLAYSINDKPRLCTSLRSEIVKMILIGNNVDPGIVCFPILRKNTYDKTLNWKVNKSLIIILSVIKAEEIYNCKQKVLLITSESEFVLNFTTIQHMKKWLSYLYRMKNKLNIIQPITKKENEIKSSSEYKLWVGTLNLGEMQHEIINLSDWITNDYDIYIYGFQECSKSKRKEWIQIIYEYIQKINTSENEIFESRSMLQINICLECRIRIKPIITKIDSSRVAKGIGGVIGNKGAVAISFSILNSSNLFVLSHFAAMPCRVVKRDNNFQEISRDLVTGEKRHDLLLQFDHIIWFGDLNYRTNLEFHAVLTLIELKKYQEILHYDQLKKQRSTGTVFRWFSEGDINFPPTYRMERNYHEYSCKKAQSLSYTDRILWKSFDDVNYLKHIKTGYANSLLIYNKGMF